MKKRLTLSDSMGCCDGSGSPTKAGVLEAWRNANYAPACAGAQALRSPAKAGVLEAWRNTDNAPAFAGAQTPLQEHEMGDTK